MRTFDAMAGVFGRVGTKTLASVVFLAAGSVGAIGTVETERSEREEIAAFSPVSRDSELLGMIAQLDDDDEWAEEFYQLLVLLCILIDCMSNEHSNDVEFAAQSYIQAYEVHGVSTQLTKPQATQGIKDIDKTIHFLNETDPLSLTPGTRTKFVETLMKIRGVLVERN